MLEIAPVVAKRKTVKWVLAGVCLALASASGWVYARAPQELLATIALAELPRQGQQVYTRIFQGGPFDSEKDGTVFGNRERLLPAGKRGFYREYTVLTPGVKNRGIRRIVCGGQPRMPDVCYYTADHYESFRKIVP